MSLVEGWHWFQLGSKHLPVRAICPKRRPVCGWTKSCTTWEIETPEILADKPPIQTGAKWMLSIVQYCSKNLCWIPHFKPRSSWFKPNTSFFHVPFYGEYETRGIEGPPSPLRPRGSTRRASSEVVGPSASPRHLPQGARAERTQRLRSGRNESDAGEKGRRKGAKAAEVETGLLTRNSCCNHLKHGFFCTQIKGTH